MATISFGTYRGSGIDEALGARVLYDPDTAHYTLDNVVLGFGGNDILQSLTMPISVDGQILSFNSTLDGGTGDDTITGNSAGDYMIGGTGNDYLSGDGMDSMFGGGGFDVLALDSTLSRADLVVSYAAQAVGPVVLSNGSVISGFEKFFVTSGGGNDSVDLSGDAHTLDSSFQSGGGRDALILNSATRGSVVFVGEGGADTVIANLSALVGAVTFESVGVGGQLNSTGLVLFCGEVERFHLTTGAGNDRLSGGGFADRFVSGGGDDSLRGGGGKDALLGQGGNDTLSGEDGRDRLDGGIGSDTLGGGAEIDTLVGGLGGDIFVFANVSDTGLGAAADRIQDFVAGVDKIALDRIVADPGVANDPGFAFVTAFAGNGAQVRAVLDEVLNTTVIEGRIAGDDIPDFTIILKGLHSLSAGDFIL